MTILDDGLDEMAARAYQGLGLRMAATAGSAGVASLMLPWQICLAWLATQTISEAIFAVVSRPQFLGRRASPARRLSYLATIVSGCGLWTLLAGLLWVNGTPEGIVSAVILWMSVIFFAQNNAYQSTTGFLVGGGIPAIGMIAMILLAPNHMHVAILPVAGLALIALGFVADGVMRSLGIRRRMQDTQARLMASEAQYRMLADNINDVLCLNAYDGRRITSSL